MTIGYAFWNGNMDASTRDIPVLVYDDTTWNKENLEHGQNQVMSKGFSYTRVRQADDVTVVNTCQSCSASLKCKVQ